LATAFRSTVSAAAIVFVAFRLAAVAASTNPV
jgi:hypothetical protein